MASPGASTFPASVGLLADFCLVLSAEGFGDLTGRALVVLADFGIDLAVVVDFFGFLELFSTKRAYSHISQEHQVSVAAQDLLFPTSVWTVFPCWSCASSHAVFRNA